MLRPSLIVAAYGIATAMLAAPPGVPVAVGQTLPTAPSPAEILAQPAVPPTSAPTDQQVRDPNVQAVESFYRLQPSDVVLVRYRYTPEYDTTVAVRPDGFVTLPIVGEVRIAGMTVASARREIVEHASVRLRDPELTVELQDFQRPRFVVGGQVGKPGQFELRGRVTLLEAIAMAGGFKTSAKHSQVVLLRRFDDDRAVTRVVNAKELERPEAMVENPVLMPGDFLFVPQNRISKVERFIPIHSIFWLMNIVLP